MPSTTDRPRPESVTLHAGRDHHGAYVIVPGEDTPFRLSDTQVGRLLGALLPRPDGQEIELRPTPPVPDEDHVPAPSRPPVPKPSALHFQPPTVERPPSPVTGPAHTAASPTAPRPTPPSPTSPAPVAHSTITGSTPVIARHMDPATMEFLPMAREWADRLGITEKRIAEIWDDPTDEWVAQTRTGEASVVTDGQIAVAVGITDLTILSVTPLDRAEYSRPRQTATPRGHGGSGRRYVTSGKELSHQLRELNFEVELQHGGHVKVRKDGKTYTMPATPSDGRSLMNSIKGIESTFDVSLDLGR